MKIIDFAKKGNVVRFYLGDDDLENWGGDDWEDLPYDLNAEPVYEKYVKATRDVAFGFDWLVLEPSDDYRINCQCSKYDMVDRRIPCLVIVPPALLNDDKYDVWSRSFTYWREIDGIIEVYFGEHLDPADSDGGSEEEII